MKKEVRGRRASDKEDDKIILKIDGFWEWLSYNMKYRPRTLIFTFLGLLLGLSISISILLNLSFGWDSSGHFYIKWEKAADIKIEKKLED